MGPDYQEQHTVGQHAGNEVDISPLNHTQLAGDAFFDLEAALQLPGLLSWEPDSRVVLGQDDGTAQQPTFSQQPFPQTLTNDEFAFQWQDLNASAFAQQIPDHDTIGQTFLNEEPLDQQIHDLHDPTQTFAGQGVLEQQMLLQQPFVGYTVGQEISGLVWTQQSIPDQISLNYVPLQPLFMEQQEQVEVPQFPATRAALGIAPCHILAAIEAPSSEVTPHFDMCGRCNEPFEVARNRGDACLFHRGKSSPSYSCPVYCSHQKHHHLIMDPPLIIEPFQEPRSLTSYSSSA
ncbi:hypothetical protein SLS61_003232 [Didymella pomorum]